MKTIVQVLACLSVGVIGSQAQDKNEPAKPKLAIISASEPDQNRSVQIVLLNQASQTVTAYVLNIKEFDSSGKLLADWNFGVENLYYNATGDPSDKREAALVRPGKTFTRAQNLSPESASAQISVAAVMYADRTSEGQRAAVEAILKARKGTAAWFHDALSALGPYPDNLEGARAGIDRLREHGGGMDVLYEDFGLPLEIVGDAKVALPTIPMPSKETWEAAARRISEASALYAAQSEEVRQ